MSFSSNIQRHYHSVYEASKLSSYSPSEKLVMQKYLNELDELKHRVAKQHERIDRSTYLSLLNMSHALTQLDLRNTSLTSLRNKVADAMKMISDSIAKNKGASRIRSLHSF